MRLLNLMVVLRLLLFLAFSVNTSSAFLMEVFAVVKTISKIVSYYEEGKSKIEERFNEKEEGVLERLSTIYNEIGAIRKDNSQSAVTTESFNRFISKNVPTMLKTIQVLDDITNRISARYDQMMTYKDHKEKLETKSLVSFAEWAALPNADSIEHLMDRLHLTMFGHTSNAIHRKSSTETLLYQMMKNYEEATYERCSTLKSPQQFVDSLYSDIALAELKAYTMMEFSLSILRVTGHGNFTEEMNVMRLNYKKRTEYALSFLKDIMEQADRRIWRSDPPVHIKGVTYDEVTRLLQGYIENEDGLNADRTCKRTCDAYQYTRVSGCVSDSLCEVQPKCKGEVRSCKFMSSAMNVCQSLHSSSRRYEYVQYGNGKVLGTEQRCGRDKNSIESWGRWIFWRCSYCFCLCDEHGLKSDRFFNLRETVSDVEANKVVTGVRFVKKNRIFHLQIQQGQVLPSGAINESTVEWKPADDYQIHHQNVRQGVDYHAMEYWNRGIDLGEVLKTDDKTFVVTGVRFRLNRSILKLDLRFTKFDFLTGKLNESVWQSSEKERHYRLNLDNLDVPTKTRKLSEQVSDRHYLEFVNTGIEVDAAQTTIPFIDVQDVVSKDPLPLAGIGIYYKAVEGYGGFVAPKIIQYDFTPHIPLEATLPT